MLRERVRKAGEKEEWKKKTSEETEKGGKDYQMRR